MRHTFSSLMNSLQFLRGSDNITEECTTVIDEYSFYQFSLIPAVCLTLLMAFTKPRTQKWLDLFKGRPGLIYPMDTLTRLSRLSYCAAFGAIAFLIYQITLEAKFAIDYNGPLSIKSLIVILSMFIYGLVFFPIFACLALRTAFGYALGSLYIWVFFIIDVYSLAQCTDDLQNRKAKLIMRFLPSVACRAFLSVSLPVRFVWACKKGKYFSNAKTRNPLEKTLKEVRESYQGQHVRKLLRKPEPEVHAVGAVNKIKGFLQEKIRTLFYHRQSGFRFPSRFVAVMFVGGCVVYILTVEFLFFALALIEILYGNLDAITTTLEETFQGQSDDLNEYVDLLIELIAGAYSLAQLVYYSLIVANVISCLIILFNILNMTSSFRNNLYAMYKGDFSVIPPATEAINLCVGSIKFGGFQVAYLIWGFFIMYIILFIICAVIGIFILVLMEGYTDWLVNRVLQIWPGVLITIALIVVQKLLARFLFLQGDGKHMRLDNRRFYFIFTYFMFFYNVFLGIASCLLRIIKSICVGVLFLSRLDNSILPRKFEFFDPGFSTYKGYIHMEAAHTHPVVLVFLQLLYSLSRNRRATDSMELKQMGSYATLESNSISSMGSMSVKRQPKNRSAYFNWLVVYTLLHNPTVRMYRKGFIQSMRKAVKDGLKMPISDMPITDFDLVKLHAEKEKREAMARVERSQTPDSHKVALFTDTHKLFPFPDPSTYSNMYSHNTYRNVKV